MGFYRILPHWLSYTMLFALTLQACNESTIDPVFYGSLSGNVIYKSTGLPASNVEISTTPGTSVIYTDVDGNFMIAKIATGTYSVSAKLDGYTLESKSVTITEATTSILQLALERDQSAPPIATAPQPADMAQDIFRSVDLKWSVDNKSNDELMYRLKLFESNSSTPLIDKSELTDTTYTVTGLRFNTTYYWQITVTNSSSVSTFGELWTFTTLPFPDNRIVFASQREGNYEIYSVFVNGDSLARLTYNASPDVYPKLSNDRSWIAFSSVLDLDFQLFTMNKDGSNIMQITTIPIAGNYNNGRGYCLSPDNGRFLYSNYDKLYTIDRNGANLSLVSTAPAGRHYRSCDWTSIGGWGVVETIGALPYDNEIRLVNFATGMDSLIVGNLPGVVQSPSFSIDGKYVLYTRDLAGFETPDGRQLDARMFLYELGTGTIIDISGTKPDGTNDLNPRFSPDGSKVIFENRPNDNSSSPTLWILNVADNSRTQFMEDAGMTNWK